MGFKWDNESIEHIVAVGDVKFNKDKKRVIKELHFNNYTCTTRLKSLLRRVKW